MKEKGLSGKPNNEPPSQANEPRLDRLQGSTTSFDPVGQFAYSGDQFLPMSDIPDGNHCLNEFGFAFPDTELSMQAFSESKDMPYASIHGSQNSDRSHASEVYGDAGKTTALGQ